MPLSGLTLMALTHYEQRYRQLRLGRIRKGGYTLIVTARGREATAAISAQWRDVVLSDLNPFLDSSHHGLDCCNYAHHYYPKANGTESGSSTCKHWDCTCYWQLCTQISVHFSTCATFWLM